MFLKKINSMKSGRKTRVNFPFTLLFTSFFRRGTDRVLPRGPWGRGSVLSEACLGPCLGSQSSGWRQDHLLLVPPQLGQLLRQGAPQYPEALPPWKLLVHTAGVTSVCPAVPQLTWAVPTVGFPAPTVSSEPMGSISICSRVSAEAQVLSHKLVPSVLAVPDLIPAGNVLGTSRSSCSSSGIKIPRSV